MDDLTLAHFCLPPVHSELTALPCAISAVDGKIERTYPGEPDAAGWTLFLRTAAAYVYNGDPLFANEPDAIQYLRKRYRVKIRLNRNDSLPFSES